MNECDEEHGDSHRGGGGVTCIWGLEENVKAIDLYLGSFVMRTKDVEHETYGNYYNHQAEHLIGRCD